MSEGGNNMLGFTVVKTFRDVLKSSLFPSILPPTGLLMGSVGGYLIALIFFHIGFNERLAMCLVLYIDRSTYLRSMRIEESNVRR